jgi:hypothetical protein
MGAIKVSEMWSGVSPYIKYGDGIEPKAGEVAYDDTRVCNEAILPQLNPR